MTSFRRIFAHLCAAYGLVVGLFTVGQWLIPDTWSIMTLYVTGAHLLLLGAVVLFPLALLIGQPRRLALALLPVVLVCLSIYGGQFIPSRALDGDGEESLRVMTYNTLVRTSGHQALVDVILAADADVVALQELDPVAAQVLRAGLSDEYPYMALDDNTNGYIGAGFLSRFPIIESAYLIDSFGNQRVLIDVDGTPIVFYNMHASVPRGWGANPFNIDISNQTSDVNVLLERVSQETERVIVLGDFNLTDLTDNYQALADVLVDSYRQVGWGMGWTHAGPLVGRAALMGVRFLRIDYIFTSPDGLRPLNAMVWHESGGSDHLPVVATIEIRDSVENRF